MKQIHFALLVLTLTISSLSVHSIVIRYKSERDLNRDLPEESLQLAREKAFDSVGKLSLVFANSAKNKFIETSCTGTLIDQRTVLTTADCIEPLIKYKDYSFFQDRPNDDDNSFILGNDAWNAPLARGHVVSALYYEGYKVGVEKESQNLALLFIDKPITSVKPAQLFDGDLEDLIDSNIVFVGFGFAGNPVSGISPALVEGNLPYLDYLKRACQQKIKTHDDRAMLQTVFQEKVAYLSGMFTHGDQGGPLFYQAENGEWYLAGVNAWRVLPDLERMSLAAKQDPRYVAYGTTGFSVAVVYYLDWIKKNTGLKTAQRSKLGKNSEWSFHPHWHKHRVPSNTVANYWKVLVERKGILLVDGFNEIEELVINHQDAKVYLPFAQAIAATENETEAISKDFYDKGKLFEAVEYNRSLIKRIDEKHALRKSQLTSNTITLQQGALQIDGELFFDQMDINGGVLMGSGELIHATIPVLNGGGKLKPGSDDKLGTLTIWGDYEQLDKSEGNPGGSLSIRVEKSKEAKKKPVLKSDHLKVMGQARLGGTLEISATKLPLAPRDQVHILSTQALEGRFTKVKGPAHLKTVVEYGAQGIKVKFLEIEKLDQHLLNNQNITIFAGQELSLQSSPSFESILIDGGVLNGSQVLYLGNNGLTFVDGILRANGSGEDTHEFVIEGNYRQVGGKLSLKLLNMSGRHDSVRVKGMAHLAGHLELHVAREALIENGSTIKILGAEEIEGQFDSTEELLSILQPVLIYSPQEVWVKFVAGRYSDAAEFKNPKVKKFARVLDEARADKQKFEESRDLYLLLDRVPKKELEDVMDVILKQHML